MLSICIYFWQQVYLSADFLSNISTYQNYVLHVLYLQSMCRVTFLNFKKKLYGGYLNMSCLYLLKMDSHHKKGHLRFKIRIGLALKVEKNLAGEFFLLDFSLNWTILSHLVKGFFRPFHLQKGHKGQNFAKLM